MSLGNLLETKAVSYLELIGNGKTYVVPPYQRDHSWTEEQWDDLWQDVILASLETDAGNGADPDTDPGTIEHILPENPAGDWESSVSPDRWEEARDRIGNLTLLEAPLNRLVGNASYAEKVGSYKRSKYALTSRLAHEAPSEWTLAHIAKRPSRLAERAVHIWRADYA